MSQKLVRILISQSAPIDGQDYVKIDSAEVSAQEFSNQRGAANEQRQQEQNQESRSVGHRESE